MPQPTTKFPRLTVDLKHHRAPDICQACGSQEEELQRWAEHDDNDKVLDPPAIVVLCKGCAKRIINPHPRLYAEIHTNHPAPGSMRHLCLWCEHRDGLDCTHPKLKRNGGPGLVITTAQPFSGHVSCRGQGGRRGGYFFTHYPAPASACEGNPNPRPDTLL